MALKLNGFFEGPAFRLESASGGTPTPTYKDAVTFNDGMLNSSLGTLLVSNGLRGESEAFRQSTHEQHFPTFCHEQLKKTPVANYHLISYWHWRATDYMTSNIIHSLSCIPGRRNARARPMPSLNAQFGSGPNEPFEETRHCRLRLSGLGLLWSKKHPATCGALAPAQGSTQPWTKC